MTSHFLGLGVGDAVPASLRDGPDALFQPGPPRWHALICAPQREDAAERWLAERGVYAFHPVTRRNLCIRGHRREVVSRYLPGYVFARFPGEPVSHLVLGGPFLRDVLRTSWGEWGVLGIQRLRALHGMRRIDQAAKSAHAAAVRQARSARRLRVGGEALFKAGVFAGARCHVVEVSSATGAKVRLELFGREAIVVASPDDLVGLDVTERT